MEESNGFGLADYGRIIRKHVIAVLLIPVLCASAALIITLRTEPTYRASASVYLSLQAGESVSELVQGSTYVQNLVRSYASIASMPIVLDAVIDDLGLDTTAQTLSKSVTTSAPLDTAIIKIEVMDHSPERAAQIANAISDQLAVVVGELAPGSVAAGEEVKITTVAPAITPTSAAAPNKKLDVAVGLAAGIALAAAYIVAAEALSTRIRSERDLEGLSEVPLLGSVPANRALARSPLAARQDPFGPSAEAFRHLRTGLLFVASMRPLRSLVVTSPSAGEGKSTVSISLAETYANSGLRVLVIDADLRRPSLASLVGIEGGAGLTDVLTGAAEVADVLQEYGPERVKLLAAGRIPPNPSELLGSDQMTELLSSVLDEFDVVILDSAPILPVTDAAVLGGLADGLLLVVRGGRTKRNHLRLAISRLAEAGVAPVGLVLNSTAQSKQAGYGSYEPEASQRRPIP